MPSIRYDRIGEEIKKALSEVIRELKDPRISFMTTIMSVSVTSDLELAKVRVSVYDKDEEARKASVEALNYAKGFIAREVGKRIDIRRMPKLRFELDTSIEYSIHIAKLLDEVHKQDQHHDEQS